MIKEINFCKLVRKKKKSEIEKMLIASLVVLSVSRYPDKTPQEVFEEIKNQSKDYE